LSLAIGKKGQNVRLAAKLLGWKIDIKSEEEKRQEVESAMAALVPAGAPVSILIDHGLAEDIVEKLIENGVGTVEKLGSMTPEELELIPGIESPLIARILDAVNSYYSQFETPVEAASVEEVVVEDQAPSDYAGDLEAGAAGHEPAGPAEEASAPLAESDGPDVHPPDASTELAGAAQPVSAAHKDEFDTIKDSEHAG
jgi:transcription termination/antitermination protein NusA